MGWSKDYGKSAKVNAEYAKEQGDVAKQEAANLAKLKTDAEGATANATTAATNANTATQNANAAKTNADNAASEAITQANYAKNEGDRAKAEADRLAGTDVSVLDNKIGSLSSLNTTNKTSVVASVNEVTTQLAQTAKKSEIDNLNVRINDVIQSADLDPNKDQEVVDARDGEATLGAKVRKIDEQRVALDNELLGETIKALFNTSTRNSVSQNDYLIIANPKLTEGVKYAFEFIPNTTFTQSAIQIGTNSTSASMVSTLGNNINFVVGESYWIENFVAGAKDLSYVRILGNALKIDQIKVYTYNKTGGKIPVIEDKVGSIEAQMQNVVKNEDLMSLNNELQNLNVELLGAITKEPFNTSIRYDTSRDNYLAIVNPKLTKGVKYALEFVPNTTFTQASIQIGTNSTSASMVDTLAVNVNFVAGKSYWIEDYVASAQDLAYIRIPNNALKIDSINVYTYGMLSGRIPSVESRIQSIEEQTNGSSTGDETSFHLATKLNANISEMRSLQNVINNSVSSLLKVQDATGITKTINLPAVGERRKYILRVGLHYGSEKFTPSPTEIFFDKQCKKDFSDVRFFDSNGKMLKAQLGKLVNMDLLEDNNLHRMLKFTSDGTIVGFQTGSGIVLSQDNGVTYTPIPNTANVTENASASSSRKDMYPVFVDSNDNIFAYAGGILYKLYASDNYVTIKNVLDFSWDNEGTKVYPDIQDHAMDESQNGALIFGTYQPARHTDIFRSVDGGETFELSWHNYFGAFQHVHHIHADKFSNKVYAGIDDGGSTFEGARILVTENDGGSWTDITDRQKGIRGRDYYPTYFGEDYRLGGGESYLNGGGAIYKADANDSNFKIKVKGFGGVRSYTDFGTDELIIAGLQHARGNSVNQILISDDKGETWDVIYSKQQDFLNSSGGGFRRGYSARTVKGDTEPCVIFSRDFGNVRPMRIYQGGDHYYREAYIELEDILNEPIEITAKTGYMMEYPYLTLNERVDEGLVYEVPLNEGVGSFVTDNLGNIVKITGSDFEWERQEEPVRYGDYKEYGKPFIPSSGIKLEQGTTINFGKIPKLNFSKGYTVTFWINNKNRWSDPNEYPKRSSEVLGLFSAGNVTFFNKMVDFGYAEQSVSKTNFANTGYSMMSVPANGYAYSDQYHFVAMSVDENGHVKVYVNGGNEPSFSILKENKLFTLSNLSEGDFVIGSDSLPMAGFLSEIKIYNRVIGDKEIMEFYKGWQ